jgi:hypothetical protein
MFYFDVATAVTYLVDPSPAPALPVLGYLHRA